ncbi:unnamed protein product [Closterium sp. NIES-53]
MLSSLIILIPHSFHSRFSHGAGGAGAGGTGAGDPGAGGAGAGDPGAGGAGAGGAGARGTSAGGTAQRRPFFVPPPPSSLPPPYSVLRQVLSLPSSTGLTSSLLCPPPHQSQPQLEPDSPLPAPSPYTEQTGSLIERREPESRPASPVRAVRTGRRFPRPRPPPVPGTHIMALRPSSVPLRVPLPSPPASSLADGPDPDSDLVRVASPTVTRLLTNVVTDPSFESAAASALVAELADFAANCRLDYAAILVAESEFDCPPSVGSEYALRTDVLEERQEEFESLAAAAITGPYSSQWQTAMDEEMASWKSTGTYIDVVPPPGANIVDGMWIFIVKWPTGSPPAFKAHYVARGFSQRQGVEFFQTFSTTPKMTTLPVLLQVAAQSDYELHSLDFSTTFLQGSLHKEIWLRRPPGFTGSYPADTSLPPFYIFVYVDDLFFATADTKALAHVKSELQKSHTCTNLEPSGLYPEIVGCLMYLMTCIRPDLAYPLSILARYVAPGRHRPEHWEAAKSVLRYLCSTSGMGLVLGGQGPVVLSGHADASICEAVIYAGAMAAQELHWLTYLLTDLGE